MSAVITWMIVVILAACVAVGFYIAVKKASRAIAIFFSVILLAILVRTFFTRENLNKLHENVEKTGIGDTVERAITGTDATKSSGDKKDADAAASVTTEAARPADAASSAVPVAAKEVKPAEVVPSPVPAATETAKPAEVAAPVTAAETAKPVEAVAVDHSKYDKGRKTFTYALPFNVKVDMSFRDGAYRFIAESLGELSASEKKEIGRLIVKSLSAYRGEEASVDKTKVSVDVKYDADSNRTKVFMVVPLDALEM